MEQQKNYSIGIFLYSDELYPHQYSDAQENTYDLNQDQYERFKSMTFEDTYEMHEWFIQNLESENIFLASEFESGIADLDDNGFDYHTQKSLFEYKFSSLILQLKRGTAISEQLQP